MKIVDETLTFKGKNRVADAGIGNPEVMRVSSNRYGEHEMPSINIEIDRAFRPGTESWGTDDVDQIKDILRHIAKMAGLAVTIVDVDTEVTDTHPDVVKLGKAISHSLLTSRPMVSFDRDEDTINIDVPAIVKALKPNRKGK